MRLSEKATKFWKNMYQFFDKGQVITKYLFGTFNSPQKRTKNLIYYYGTSSRIVFVRFLGEVKTPKINFETNWPLARNVIKWGDFVRLLWPSQNIWTLIPLMYVWSKKENKTLCNNKINNYIPSFSVIAFRGSFGFPP